jgi:hypothetical protein
VPVEIGAGLAFAVMGYTIQETLIARHKLRASTLPRRERRHGERATEVAGATLEQQAEDLAAAIDVMVAFIDGAARANRARSCAKQITALVAPERRGTMTVKFLGMVEGDAPAAEIKEAAEEVCVQMAIELRGILNRAKARHHGEPPLTLEQLQPSVVAPEEDGEAVQTAAAAIAEDEPAPPEPAPPPAARPAWEVAEAEIAGMAGPHEAAPDAAPARPKPRKRAAPRAPQPPPAPEPAGSAAGPARKRSTTPRRKAAAEAPGGAGMAPTRRRRPSARDAGPAPDANTPPAEAEAP